MLIKYLNELDAAVKRAVDMPAPEQFENCLECVSRLETYLQSQLEPVRRKGMQIMGELLPAQFDEWMPQSRQLHTLGRPRSLHG